MFFHQIIFILLQLLVTSFNPEEFFSILTDMEIPNLSFLAYKIRNTNSSSILERLRFGLLLVVIMPIN